MNKMQINPQTFEDLRNMNHDKFIIDSVFSKMGTLEEAVKFREHKLIELESNFDEQFYINRIKEQKDHLASYDTKDMTERFSPELIAIAKNSLNESLQNSEDILRLSKQSIETARNDYLNYAERYANAIELSKYIEIKD